MMNNDEHFLLYRVWHMEHFTVEFRRVSYLNNKDYKKNQVDSSNNPLYAYQLKILYILSTRQETLDYIKLVKHAHIHLSHQPYTTRMLASWPYVGVIIP